MVAFFAHGLAAAYALVLSKLASVKLLATIIKLYRQILFGAILNVNVITVLIIYWCPVFAVTTIQQIKQCN